MTRCPIPCSGVFYSIELLPEFWQGVSIGADLVALALILDSDCYTRIDAWGYPYQVCYDDRDYRDRPQRPHRPHRPRHP